MNELAAATNEVATAPPPHYTRAIRCLLRFALIMTVLGLLSGVLFQESAKKVSLTPEPGQPAYWDTTLRLAVVHGHMIVTGLLVPVAMAAMLHLALSHGGRPVGPRGLAWAIYLYVPFVSLTVALMLYKAYYFLLSVRWGERDMVAIDKALFGGQTMLRHLVYGVGHVGMAAGLFIFVWCLWRSLKPAKT